MGYCMNQNDCCIKITAEQQKKAFKPVQKKLLSSVKTVGGGWGGRERTYSWVDTDEIKNAKTLIDILHAFRWNPEIDDKGDIISLLFGGEKLGDDKFFFDVIAPYVEEGGFIEMVGEDNCIWRWIFKKEKCKEVAATITFED